MASILKLVLTDYWFEEIKSGRKTHEYRRKTKYWENRLNWNDIFREWIPYVQFQKAYRKNPETMIFEILYIAVVDGLNTDLHCAEPVFDIKLGKRVYMSDCELCEYYIDYADPDCLIGSKAAVFLGSKHCLLFKSKK